MSDQDRDPWEEFDGLKPAGPGRVAGYPGGERLGFGFRTGCAQREGGLRVAIYALVLGTVLVLVGAVVFTGQANGCHSD